MRKSELTHRSDIAVEQTREALQAIYDCLNKGQRIQIAKFESVKTLFDRYGVNFEK